MHGLDKFHVTNLIRIENLVAINQKWKQSENELAPKKINLIACCFDKKMKNLNKNFAQKKNSI
ncbi:hypothetical protein BpHYR1_027871 [Brachionus plicatilis]|uniref:Uncharacterized protein n=1 Tax=Brachionus plicatilis TaxID=10195 RepID=A0A3M7SAR0_BRAPC|nr:hypothetical protein BpHYR1_027871 [Brachionus plicatilis]